MDAGITPPDYLPAEVVAWAQENRGLLERLVEELLGSGAWPQLGALTRSLAREGRPIALERALADMPRPLGFLDMGQDRRIVLLLHGLRMTTAGRPLLDGFASALRVARDRYAADEDSAPILRRTDLPELPGSSEHYVDALGEILIREAPFLGGGSGLASEDWSREVTTVIVNYWDVTDADTYLQIRAEELRLLPRSNDDDAGPQRSPAGTGAALSGRGPAVRQATQPSYSYDVFISHAGEDKDTVARPLAAELDGRGLRTWLDELELTLGDSLSRRIDDGLIRSRFGVVILSPSFFSKEWPQRELAGLAAREIDSGAKVILPVWHRVDHRFIVRRSPVLADRLGVQTSAGIEKVADAICLALGQAGSPDVGCTSRQGDATGDREGEMLFPIPVTRGDQDRLLAERPEWWEYRLYAGVLMQGRIDLEAKWQRHQLRLPTGSWRTPAEPVPDLLARATRSASRQMEILDRLFESQLLVRAFGAPGTAGDPDLIAQIARGVVQTYESMLDWASELRATSVDREYEELLELTARMVDGPAAQIRDFIQDVADQIARIPMLLQEAAARGATSDSPTALDLILHVELNADNQRELQRALGRLS